MTDRRRRSPVPRASVRRSCKTTADSAGKSAACWLGASQAVGKYLLFLDADTFFLAEDGLERLFAAYEERSGQGLLGAAYHQTKRLYEQLSAVFNVVLPVGLNRFSIVGEKLSAGGAFVYFVQQNCVPQANGHQDMPQGILDDLALARRFKKKRLPRLVWWKRLCGLSDVSSWCSSTCSRLDEGLCHCFAIHSPFDYGGRHLVDQRRHWGTGGTISDGTALARTAFMLLILDKLCALPAVSATSTESCCFFPMLLSFS